MQDQFQEVGLQPQPYEADQEIQIMLQLQKHRFIYKGDGQKVRESLEKQTGDDDQFLFGTQQTTGEQFAAIKPWKGALCKQLDLPQKDNSIPSVSLQLEFVNGINTLEMSQMVFYLNKISHIVYPAACLGVVMDKNNFAQKYFGGKTKQLCKSFHIDDIISLDFLPSKNMVATGSIGKNPDICIWNPDTMKLISKFQQGVNTRAVATIRFSKDGKLVFTTDRSQKNVLRAFTIQGKQLSSFNCSTPIFQMATSSKNQVALATNRGCFLFSFQGNAFKKTTLSSTLCLTVDFSDSDQLFIGNNNGTVSKGKAKAVKVCQGAVFGLCAKQGKLLVSGSKEKCVRILSQSLQEQSVIQFSDHARSIDYKDGHILVALRNGIIMEAKGQKKHCIINGHFAGEVWGLTLNCEKNCQIITSGDDNKLLVFDIKKKQVINQLIINTKEQKGKLKASTLSPLPGSQQARALALNPKSKQLAMACNNGQIFIFSSTLATKPSHCLQPSKDWCQIMRYSPCGKFLAVGYHDQIIYLLQVQNSYKVKYKMKKHSSFIVSIDWSQDSAFLRTVSGAYELLYWNVQTGQQEVFSPVCKWTTQGKFGLATQGIWQEIVDGSFVNTIERSNNRKFLFVGEDDGCVRIYRNPAVSKKYVSYKAHSSHVMKGLWCSDDKYLVTVGGYDKTMMIWQVTVK